MIDIRSVWASTSIQFRRLIGSRKSAVILGCQLIFCYNIFIPMTQMAQVYRERIPPVAFVFYLSFYRMLVLHGGMAIFLFSDILSNDCFSLWQILRMGKRNHYLGQVLYVFLISFIYMILLYALSFIMTLPVLGSFSDWGKLMHTMSENLGGMVAATGIQASFSINQMVLNTMTPCGALLVSMLLLWLTTSFIGITILFFTVILNRSAGIAIAGVMVAMTIFAMFAGFVTLGRWLNYISPLSWSYIGLLDLTKSGNWPTVRYAITFLLAGILLMTGSAMLWYTNKDLRG